MTYFFDAAAAAQDSPSPGWEKAVVEFFKEQLKEKSAQSLVRRLLQKMSPHTPRVSDVLLLDAGSVSERRSSALPEAQQFGEVPLLHSRHV